MYKENPDQKRHFLSKVSPSSELYWLFACPTIWLSAATTVVVQGVEMIGLLGYLSLDFWRHDNAQKKKDNRIVATAIKYYYASAKRKPTIDNRLTRREIKKTKFVIVYSPFSLFGDYFVFLRNWTAGKNVRTKQVSKLKKFFPANWKSFKQIEKFFSKTKCWQTLFCMFFSF